MINKLKRLLQSILLTCLGVVLFTLASCRQPQEMPHIEHATHTPHPTQTATPVLEINQLQPTVTVSPVPSPAASLLSPGGGIPHYTMDIALNFLGPADAGHTVCSAE